jgi:translation initiation factor 1
MGPAKHAKTPDHLADAVIPPIAKRLRNASGDSGAALKLRRTMRGPQDDRELVYSSDAGWTDTGRRKPARPAPAAQTRAVPCDGVVRVLRERRRGGIVCVVTGLRSEEFQETAALLKRLCGAGGTAKNGVVEIQGDHRDKIVAWFAQRGRKAKRAGG